MKECNTCHHPLEGGMCTNENCPMMDIDQTTLFNSQPESSTAVDTSSILPSGLNLEMAAEMVEKKPGAMDVLGFMARGLNELSDSIYQMDQMARVGLQGFAYEVGLIKRILIDKGFMTEADIIEATKKLDAEIRLLSEKQQMLNQVKSN